LGEEDLKGIYFMSTWFYQMNQAIWPPTRYRAEIWEGENWHWSVGRMVGAKEEPPGKGDIVVFFYAKSGGDDFGVYGWAIILEWAESENTLYFRTVAPSDRLKMTPWNDGSCLALADEVRGTVKRGTLWRITADQEKKLRKGINNWLQNE
jgi:hypothetical protein